MPPSGDADPGTAAPPASCALDGERRCKADDKQEVRGQRVANSNQSTNQGGKGEPGPETVAGPTFMQVYNVAIKRAFIPFT